MVMAGGGFRFGYYLGIYAAACQRNKAPDLLLASCGGAIAAAIIQVLPDDAERKAWLSSYEMYAFWCQLRSARHATLTQSFISAFRRRYFMRSVKIISDLFHDYLFEIPAVLPLPPNALHSVGKTPALGIIGGKLLYEKHEVGQRRGARKLFAETLFCNDRTGSLLVGMSSALGEIPGQDNAIAPHIITDSHMSLNDAVRISIADMFYFPCYSHVSGNYIGGVIDLFPLEIANRLADSVMMELKQPFDQAFAIPALRTVLGIDGNARLRHVHAQFADTWIDTSDAHLILANQQIRKRLSWQHNQIRLDVPSTHAKYVAQIEAQWEYGYQRGLEACEKGQPNCKKPMRHVTKHNKAEQ